MCNIHKIEYFRTIVWIQFNRVETVYSDSAFHIKLKINNSKTNSYLLQLNLKLENNSFICRAQLKWHMTFLCAA
jgi:hypothetical protein